MRSRTLAIALLCVCTHIAVAESPQLKVTAGLDYSTGDYGDVEDTEILFVPVTASYLVYPWTLKVTVPYLRIEGPGVVAGDAADVVVGDDRVTTGEGLGDVVAGVLYSLDPFAEGRVFLDLTAKIKLPTADEQDGLGTGEPDYTLQADLARAAGAWVPFATLGYQFLGSSASFDLNNRAFFSLGADCAVNARHHVGVVYDYRQASSDSGEAGSEGTLYASRKISDAWSVSGYVVRGFSEGSPDWGAGAQVSRRF